MSRLQVGGLALIIHSSFPENVGKVTMLIHHLGISDCIYGEVDCWLVDASQLKTTNTSNPSGFSRHPTKYLMPLGDNKGIELYGLREEIMTGHDKEAV
ncbi:hypothetical protein APC39_15540 [Acinetobacter pittii]|uniref:hypothetical protein n=1 Tax=Acinetobacter pittii TaxID=48296 RepID=UPI000707D1F9|nr:hypothetical protein [Acinetobacter pittii]KQG36996.1 hypothetical protein APC39_15540 [Acinetobacter pittii]